jgi:hypothetical protein
MQAIRELILSQRGWLIRQVLKLAAAGGTVLTTWLASKSVEVDVQAIGAALATLAVGITEVVLSRFSDKLKTEELGIE